MASTSLIILSLATLANSIVTARYINMIKKNSNKITDLIHDNQRLAAKNIQLEAQILQVERKVN